jgi:hypothetical protein
MSALEAFSLHLPLQSVERYSLRSDWLSLVARVRLLYALKRVVKFLPDGSVVDEDTVHFTIDRWMNSCQAGTSDPTTTGIARDMGGDIGTASPPSPCNTQTSLFGASQ